MADGRALNDQTSWVRQYVRSIDDYPTEGVTYRDVTPLMADAAAFGRSIDDLITGFGDVAIDLVVGIEARGFILAAPVAYRLRAGFIPVRKAGKLPWAVVREEYELEYGSDKLEVHRDAIAPGTRVLVVDDVLATGGTAAAAATLVHSLGGDIVGFGFLLEISELAGRDRLGSGRVESLAVY